MFKKLFSFLAGFAVLVIVGVITFNYLTRPVKAPSSQTAQAASVASVPAEPVPAGAFRIVAEKSHADFALDEVLRGTPTHVVGTTSDVSGSIVADPNALGAASLGEIRVNARTLKTDDAHRNGMMGRFILKSEDDANEFIVFKPTKISGLPKTATAGQPFDLTITGDLTIAGVTRETTFTASSQFTSDTELTGSADATVKRGDFNLVIPNIPFVANVSEDVKLTINFTAEKGA